jgi:protein-disulfide isomerase
MMKPLIAAAVAALALAGCEKKDDAAFGARVRTYLLAHPEVLQETIDALHRKQQVEAVKASSAMIAKYRAQLERDPRDPVVNPAGTVTVVEFFDYRCGYCKLIAPHVVELIRENPDVRFVFKQFPIFGDVSDDAARMALTPDAKAKTLAIYQSWMADRGLDEAALDRHLTEAGLDPAAVRKAAAGADIHRQILDVHALAEGLGLEGTPAFVVGDTLVPGADLEALKAAIQQAKAKKRVPQAT